MANRIFTVKGPINAEEMGTVLPHEHILCDFIGAKETGKHRYRVEEVVDVMLPYLQEIMKQGITGFVDCTPMYIGRDAGLLRTLSETTGLHIVTNTGQYKEPFLPRQTFEIDAEALAAQWIEEWETGIENTGIKPGFIKTAVNPGPLIPVQRKVTRAAALASKATGLTVATHTGVAVAAAEILEIFEHAGVEPGKWVYVHAQNEEDPEKLLAIAKRGAWIELDGIGPGKEQQHLRPLLQLLEAGFEQHILLSQDAGWYRVGEEHGGEQRPFGFLFERFLPLMREKSISDETIRTLTARNPARAFSVSG